jgi:hypothetical protein
VTLTRTIRRRFETVALVAVVVLVAATAFGLWHLLVGGLINGNPRAAAFGAVLALVAGALLAGVIAGRRRLHRG